MKHLVAYWGLIRNGKSCMYCRMASQTICCVCECVCTLCVCVWGKSHPSLSISLKAHTAIANQLQVI